MPSGSRDLGLFLQDIADSASWIVHWTAGLTREQFLEDRLTFDAVLRNLTIMGEAAKNIPAEYRDLHPEIAWRAAAGFRDIAMHSYFNLRAPMVWDIVANNVPGILTQILVLLGSPSGEG